MDGIQVLMAIGAAWLAWYVWSFAIAPSMIPDEPRPLPYLVPFVGHVWSMFTASHQLFMKGRRAFGTTPWAMTIMGQTMYVIGAPEDILSVYKATKAIEYDPFIKIILTKYGLTKDTVEQMFSIHDGGSKHWVDTSVENFNAQMHPGEKFDTVQKVLMIQIDKLLTWDQLHGRMVVQEGEDARLVSLYDWCDMVIVGAQTRTFFGEAIFDCCPDLLKLFRTYEDEAWKFPLDLPPSMTKTMNAAKDKIEDGFIKYLSLPKEARADASWIGRNLVERFDQLGLEPGQQALALFSFYRVINANAFKLTFWVLCYVLFDSSLLELLKSEVDPGFESDGTLGAEYLLNFCPLLASTCEEVMRLTNWPIGTREVTSDTVIGGKKLHAGSKIMMPYRAMHFDPYIFGNDATDFNPRRFMHKKGLLKSTSYRPFGGGSHYCPGRFLARMEVQLFVAVMLKRFTFSFDGDASFPKMDDSLPSGGIQSPAKGQNLTLRVKSNTSVI